MYFKQKLFLSGMRWIFTLILVSWCSLVVGQALPDFSSIDIANLSDSQIELLVSRAGAAGYSQDQLIQLAKSQGLSLEDVSNLNNKINDARQRRAAKASGSPVEDSRLRKSYFDSLQSKQSRIAESDIFGLGVFGNSSFLSFQNNQNIPTPMDYQLGPGDEVFIDVYGESESYYQAQVNPDGNLILENIGPINVSGLTIEEAKAKVSTKLVKIYGGLRSDKNSTFLSMSVGQIRSIKISIVGEVEIPGTYNMSSLSTAYNALYVAGGIRESGTLREIRVFRKSKLITTIDVYDFIVNGNSKQNVTLKNDDVIIVRPYTNRVSLRGAAKTSGRFELKDGETLKDLMDYGGGFAEDAFRKTIKVNRIIDGERVIADVDEDQFQVFTPRPGDIYEIGKVLNRYKNRVIVKGAVFRPGNFSITTESTVKQIIEDSEGLRPDAFLQRAFITRSREDLSLETISFNLGALINGVEPDIKLQKEDILNVLSRNDLKEEQYVEVSGEVNNAGIFAYSEGMSLQDIILLAGGFKESATGKRLEVTRRVTDELENTFSLSNVLIKDADRGFLNRVDSEPMMLKPFDHVLVRRNPNFHVQQYATVEGQVFYPGAYAIQNHGERISDLLNRAGGLNNYAFIEGATLIRRTEFFEEKTDIEEQVNDLEKLRTKLQISPELLTEAELLLVSRIENDIERLENQNKDNQSLSNFAKRERLKEILERNSLLGNAQFKQAEAIGIKLAEILANPGSNVDLLIEEGDVLVIPKKTETIRLRGKLLYPTTVRYEEGMSLKHYINSAGGFDNRAKKSGVYIVYANGEVARTKRFLFFRSYPKAAAGAEIIVPAKGLRIPLGPQAIIGITSGLATVALLISQITK